MMKIVLTMNALEPQRRDSLFIQHHLCRPGVQPTVSN